MRPARPPMVAAIEERLTIAPPCAAARGRHPPHRLAAAQHGADHVDRQQALEARLLELGDRRRAAAVDAGAVDQRGEAAEALIDLAEHALDLVLLGDIGLDGDRPAAGGLDLGGERLGALARPLVADGHRIALAGGEPRRRRADPARAAGHQHDPAQDVTPRRRPRPPLQSLRSALAVGEPRPVGIDLRLRASSNSCASSRLARGILAHVVDKFVQELAAQLADRRVHLEVDALAKAWLGDKGYDPLYGARPLARVIQEHIKRPLAEELLFGAARQGRQGRGHDPRRRAGLRVHPRQHPGAAAAAGRDDSDFAALEDEEPDDEAGRPGRVPAGARRRSSTLHRG